MEHNPRIIELRDLPRAMRTMGDLDESRAVAADRLAGGVRRAMRLDAVGDDDARTLKREAERFGGVVLEGTSGSSGPSPRILVADRETMERLGAGLESQGMKPMGAAIRLAIAAYERTAFALGFADGGDRKSVV